MSASSPRYCPCGNRLARDHASALCGPCERRETRQRAEPPAVTSGFWDTPAFGDAFAVQHMGHLARAYRRHPAHRERYGGGGISQELLGTWLGLTQAQVSRVENGSPIRNLDTLAHWARVLRIPPAHLWFTLPPGPAAPAANPPVPAAQPGAPAPAGPFQLLPISTGALPDPDIAAMRAFRSADLQVGGGHLYASVIRYLQTDMAPRLFGSDLGADNRAVFTAAAALTEMAGWMAHDAGRDTVAKQHFGRSLALAGVGRDHQLSAHILGSMSHLASHLGQPDEAIELARQGQAILRTAPPNPPLTARLLALEARGFAGHGSTDAAACTGLLRQAEKALQALRAEPASPWVSHFDDGSLASETARCMQQLGDLDEARRQAEQIITLRPGHRTRSRAFGQLTLAIVLATQDDPEQASAIAGEVLAATPALGSYLVVTQLLHVQQLLQPHHASAVVSSFLGCLDEAIPERLGLYPWLTKARHHPPGRQEGP